MTFSPNPNLSEWVHR